VRLPEVVRLSNPAAESAGETRCPPYKPALDDSTLRRDEIGIALGWTMLQCGSDATHVRADQFAENVARRLGLR
jgi:hypothetical protein